MTQQDKDRRAAFEAQIKLPPLPDHVLGVSMAFGERVLAATVADIREYARAAVEINKQSIIGEFLERTGQYVTSDANREAAIRGAFEAVRQRLCKLPRYSFFFRQGGGVQRCNDSAGNWLEFDQVHALFDPVAVDDARAAKEE